MPFNEEPDTSELPCAEALVAGTVALMTTWADPCPHCTLPTAEQRALVCAVGAHDFDARVRNIQGLESGRGRSSWLTLAVQQSFPVSRERRKRFGQHKIKIGIAADGGYEVLRRSEPTHSLIHDELPVR